MIARVPNQGFFVWSSNQRVCPFNPTVWDHRACLNRAAAHVAVCKCGSFVVRKGFRSSIGSWWQQLQPSPPLAAIRRSLTCTPRRRSSSCPTSRKSSRTPMTASMASALQLGPGQSWFQVSYADCGACPQHRPAARALRTPRGFAGFDLPHEMCPFSLVAADSASFSCDSLLSRFHVHISTPHYKKGDQRKVQCVRLVVLSWNPFDPSRSMYFTSSLVVWWGSDWNSVFHGWFIVDPDLCKELKIPLFVDLLQKN